MKTLSLISTFCLIILSATNAQSVKSSKTIPGITTSKVIPVSERLCTKTVPQPTITCNGIVVNNKYTATENGTECVAYKRSCSTKAITSKVPTTTTTKTVTSTKTVPKVTTIGNCSTKRLHTIAYPCSYSELIDEPTTHTYQGTACISHHYHCPSTTAKTTTTKTTTTTTTKTITTKTVPKVSTTLGYCTSKMVRTIYYPCKTEELIEEVSTVTSGTTACITRRLHCPTTSTKTTTTTTKTTPVSERLCTKTLPQPTITCNGVVVNNKYTATENGTQCVAYTRSCSTKTVPQQDPSTTTTSKLTPSPSSSTKCVPKTVTVTEKETVTVKQTITVTVTGKSTETKTPENCAARWAQCGGQGYSGPTCCQSGSTCTKLSDYYSQCV